MGELRLFVGGARSGKSRQAQQTAERLPGPRVYLATGQPFDDEMRDRVARHRADRAGRGWTTCEEPCDLAGALQQIASAAVVLIDCLTLWLTNCLLADQDGFDESRCEALTAAWLQVAAARARPVLVVSNEVGQGIVPESALGRRFRDLQGRCNAQVAAAAESVTWMVCGLPVPVKPLPGAR
ncbi:MAG: bifunctional adenosylcobinamide kinase/adenosylcobinamide-phosphate guanylyltransferase [Fimbriimonadaceae bacterium]|nr:bifunctional adenosylcobinamide kinase/adenosylcobinamide-phosphate guanylyltransferase [Fimbriimonadaceae bacterium]